MMINEPGDIPLSVWGHDKIKEISQLLGYHYIGTKHVPSQEQHENNSHGVRQTDIFLYKSINGTFTGQCCFCWLIPHTAMIEVYDVG